MKDVIKRLTRKRDTHKSALADLTSKIRSGQYKGSTLNSLAQQATAERRALEDAKDRLAEIRKDAPPEVSDHALVRYMQRAMGIDIDAIKATILTDKNIQAIDFAGDADVVIISKGIRMIVRNRIVITVYEN